LSKIKLKKSKKSPKNKSINPKAFIYIIDPNKALGSINMDKQYNSLENKLDIIFTINKLTAQPNEKFWMYRFENLETNEVIEVFNKF
jgi:hypothetical protein